MTDLIDRDGFRTNIGIILMGADGGLFLGRRTGGRGWQFPQGGVARGESLEQALFRELREEIGLSSADVEIIGCTHRWLRYRLPARYVRRNAKPLCIGQKQRWFLLKLTRAAVSFRFDHTAEPEFDRWRWVDYWQPIREVIYFKRAVYSQALHELGTAAFPEGLPPYPSWWRGRASTPAQSAAEPAAP